MKLRTLVAGLALIGASSGAFANIVAANSYDLGVATSPGSFLVDNTVVTGTGSTPSNGVATSTGAFDDWITFGVTPSSLANNVLFRQLQITGVQNIASATLSLWDVTSGNPLTYIFFGSVPLDEPAFTTAEVLLSGHTYALEVTGQIDQSAIFKQGVYGISGTLAPVPEPETYALMGLGLVALVAARARRRKTGASFTTETTAA